MKEKRGDAEFGQKGTVAQRTSEPDETKVESSPSANDFHPVQIKGEPLSATIIRERREDR
jgi:hypothetical protein